MKVNARETRDIKVEIGDDEFIDKLYEILGFTKKDFIEDNIIKREVDNPYFNEYIEHCHEEPYYNKIISTKEKDIKIFEALKLIKNKIHIESKKKEIEGKLKENSPFLQGKDLSDLSRQEFDKMYDKYYKMGCFNKKEDRLAFVSSANLYKTLVDEYLNLKKEGDTDS